MKTVRGDGADCGRDDARCWPLQKSGLAPLRGVEEQQRHRHERRAHAQSEARRRDRTALGASRAGRPEERKREGRIEAGNDRGTVISTNNFNAVTGKERTTRTEQRMEDTDWIKEVIKEIREVGQKIERQTKEIKKELKEMRIQIERLEKRQRQSEESEGQDETEEIGSDESSERREEETKEVREYSDGAVRGKRAVNEEEESDVEGWNEGGWGESWWNELKLPKLNLPTFSGNYEEWFPFFDTFHALIHTSESLDDVQKLYYLRASLTGDAKNIIGALEILAVNYQVAWRLLKERYDNKRVITQSYIRAIMDLPSMTRENACEMRQIADGASRHIHALQALKRPTSHWDDLLIFLLSSKLDTVSLRECQMLEATGKSNSTTAKVDTRFPAKTKRQAACAASVKFRCAHCKEEHSIYFCLKFLAFTVHQRIAEVRKAKLCANCLRSTTHNDGKCVSGACKTCKMKHNTLLYLDTSIAESQGRDEKSQSIEASTTSFTTVVTHGFSYCFDEHIMLATAVIYAFDNKESRKPCRILLDSGSQANFISKRFLDVLNIKAKDSNISILGINNHFFANSPDTTAVTH
ncbi:uncharacterized protein LOC112468245 [Temnothorax curvispinosus]|uniref:Uncharacterized protein LOC112468245 n=1 Tax=Temnothorax curvispinosus TaxID=300111 RepID=A0A6J1RK40_9HYME|nr:uncharacterized protein LOC112468245 [Temnothorax curvispinosus]